MSRTGEQESRWTRGKHGGRAFSQAWLVEHHYLGVGQIGERFYLLRVEICSTRQWR